MLHNKIYRRLLGGFSSDQPFINYVSIGRVHFISYMSMIGVKLVRESKNKFVIFYCSKKVGTKERVRAFCNFTSMSGPDEAKQWVQYIRAKIHNIPVNRKRISC